MRTTVRTIAPPTRVRVRSPLEEDPPPLPCLGAPGVAVAGSRLALCVAAAAPGPVGFGELLMNGQHLVHLVRPAWCCQLAWLSCAAIHRRS